MNLHINQELIGKYVVFTHWYNDKRVRSEGTIQAIFYHTQTGVINPSAQVYVVVHTRTGYFKTINIEDVEMEF